MRGFPTITRATVCAAAVTALIQPTPAVAESPGVPGSAAARSMLDGLTVAEGGSASGYSREKFPHWHTVSGACTTRETVLQRDGDGVVVDGECKATAGSWYSPYDEQTVTAASDIDIDHVVALAEAWRSGASGWSTEQRERFANDLDNPQLIAVTASVNRSKGDQDPVNWLPPNPAYRCTYAQMWVAVKSTWQLTVQQAEKDALARTLQGC
ncbi:HNH endonuclease family protein [Nocardia fusca]|uniref:HNH endonuclease family protein n=1 Tax=Nocardia fusca TaxID=941183 RepID=UPI0037A33C58